ncbi:MAG: hypothetical protein GXP63_03310 [DPANN group archaeon]|nr:hypothetical protein [DPANN group archaeon]
MIAERLLYHQLGGRKGRLRNMQSMTFHAPALRDTADLETNLARQSPILADPLRHFSTSPSPK